jgi:ATP-dependent protease HslVU (ClpYQ) peptidase subunit
MTTIAYNHKDKQISVDSQSTIGGMVASYNEIKWVERDDGIYFIAGYPCDNEMFFDYVDGLGDSHPKWTPECSALHIDNDGKCFIATISAEGQLRHSLVTHNYGIGSGDVWAISAMELGKTSAEAVSFAATKCIYTGGKVHTYDIATKQFI